MSRILIVEDARPIAHGIRSVLEQEGFIVRIVADGAEAVEVAHRWMPRLIILDLTLPTVDGLQVLRSLRADGHVMPVLIVSARSSEADRVRGLRVGADDYLVKPFSLDELLARVEAHFRRAAYFATAHTHNDPNADVELGKLRVDATTRVASYDDRA